MMSVSLGTDGVGEKGLKIKAQYLASYSISWVGDQASNPIYMFPTSGTLHNPCPQSSKGCLTQNKPEKQNPRVQRH